MRFAVGPFLFTIPSRAPSPLFFFSWRGSNLLNEVVLQLPAQNSKYLGVRELPIENARIAYATLGLEAQPVEDCFHVYNWGGNENVEASQVEVAHHLKHLAPDQVPVERALPIQIERVQRCHVALLDVADVHPRVVAR